MNRISFVALSIFAFLLLSPPADAEKAPVWEWDSSNAISHVAISEDSRNVSATYASTVSLWYNHTSSPQKSKIVDSQITSMAMSSDGKSVLIGEELDTTVTLYEEGTKIWETGGFFTVADVDISSNGSHIAVADWRSIHFFTRDSNEAVWSHYYEDEYMTTVSISPDGLFIAIGTQNGKVFLYPASGDNSSSGLHDNILDGDIVGIDFSADSSRLIIGTDTGRVYIYETEGGAQVMNLAYPEEEISCVSGSSDSDYYAFGTDAGSVAVINSTDSGSIQWQKNIGDAITDLDFNGVGTHLVAGTNNKIVVLAKVSDGDELWRTTASGKVSGVAMSYRGENIVVGTDEGLAIYYEQQLDNQAPIATIESIIPAIALPDTPVTMNGSVFDLDGEIVAYLWHSSINGNLSTERMFIVSNLSIGLHVITFSALDNEGRWSKGASMDIGVGDFPEAEIVSVSDCDLLGDCVISEGSTIEFIGSAVSEASNDTEVIGYSWMSDIDGPLSNKSIFSIASLSRGSHTITFRAVNDIGFWSSNVTMSLLINGVPVSSILTNPDPVQPGEAIFLVASGNDPDGGSLTYIWSSETLLFANGLTSYESDEAGSKVETSESDFGEHEISLRVVDPYGISSEISKVSIEILSFPLVSAVCDEEAVVDEELLFTAVASDRLPGRIVLYEWDFDTSTGDIESVDFKGAEYATHSYDSVPESSFYTVVVRVTDDDGLVARDTCTVDMLVESTSSSPQEDSSFFDDALGSISEIASPPVIAGIGSAILIIGAVAYYMMRRDDITLYAPTTRSQSVSSSDYMRSRVPDVSPVRQSQLLEEEFETDTMIIECPECSARMDIPNVSGTQHIQCAECGIEGEIDL